MSWSCSRCGSFMIPWFSDYMAELKKLEPLGEWEQAFEHYEHICSTCVATLARKGCSLCSKSFNVLEDCRASMIKNLRDHKQDTSTFVDKKHVCPNCFAKNSFAHCSRCKLSTLLNQNCSPKYSQSTTLRNWLSPCHPESQQDKNYASGVLCLSCYDQLQVSANAVAERYKNWVGGTKGEYIRGYRSLRTIGRIEENRLYGRTCGSKWRIPAAGRRVRYAWRPAASRSDKRSLAAGLKPIQHDPLVSFGSGRLFSLIILATSLN